MKRICTALLITGLFGQFLKTAAGIFGLVLQETDCILWTGQKAHLKGTCMILLIQINSAGRLLKIQIRTLLIISLLLQRIIKEEYGSEHIKEGSISMILRHKKFLIMVLIKTVKKN